MDAMIRANLATDTDNMTYLALTGNQDADWLGVLLQDVANVNSRGHIWCSLILKYL